MANLTRNFVAGKMNKTFDERVVPAGEYLVLSGYSNIIGSEVQGYTGRVLQTSWRSLTYNKFSSAAASIPEGYCLVELPSKKGHCLAAKELWISQS